MRLTPKDTRFYELFSTLSGHLLEGAELLVELVATAPRGVETVSAKMTEVEHAGDEATHAIMHHLNTSFITPFDREDISQLASCLDDVLDAMEASADLMFLYRIEQLPPGAAELVGVLNEAAQLTVEAMPKLRTLKSLPAYWIRINELENQADRLYRRMLAELFNNGTDAITVMKLKEVLDELEAAADAFEHVADVVQTIAAKES